MPEPLFLSPIFHEKIWGGSKLQTLFNYSIPSDTTGECWAISAHPNGVCHIKNGIHKGKNLTELWQSHQELFGYATEPVFPLLTKIIDADDDLSVQVHPDDDYGLSHVGELGKTECWYILNAKPGAKIIYGHHACTKYEFEKMVNEGNWQHLLRSIDVQKGDFFFVPSGTIHAIGKGIVILETQQSSDTTYRIYDYDRLDRQGNPRELHLQQALDVTTIPHHDPQLEKIEHRYGQSKNITLLTSSFFIIYEWLVKETLMLNQTSAYTLVSVIDGQGEIECNNNRYPLTKGMHFILPNQIKSWQLLGELHLIASIPGK